ncbi:FAD-binding protein [Microdochium nivale]|nr:FAD-binding protein [Microdochium nivale]
MPATMPKPRSIWWAPLLLLAVPAVLADPSRAGQLHQLRAGGPPGPGGGGTPPGDCRAYPGDSRNGWPSDATWAALNGTSGGRLIRPVLPGAVCHHRQPGSPAGSPDPYNAEQCAALGYKRTDNADADGRWHDQDFHVADPVSPMWNQFANDTCLPDPDAPCSAAGYPAYVLNADSVAIVKLGVDFARRHNIRLGVRSTGHDYLGRSTQPGSLSIWTRHLQGFETHLDGFKPRGCGGHGGLTIPGPAVTALGGMQMAALYAGLDRLGLTIVGGAGRTVSLGGYITGGGHSLLAPRHGLAADQVLEMQVVTADGDIVIANECQNQDLFWAMRGGGGSTFGIMTSVTMAAHPTPKLTSYDVVFGTVDVGSPRVHDMFGYILSQYPALDSKGLSGYGSFTAATNFTDPGSGATIAAAGGSLNFILADSTDPAEIRAAMDPIVQHLLDPANSEAAGGKFPAGIFLTSPPVVAAHGSFWAYYDGAQHSDTSSAGRNLWVGSRLLDARALADADKLSSAYRSFMGTQGGTGYLVVGNGTRNARPRGGGNAVNPSFRRAVSHSTNGLAFEPLDPAARARALVELNGRLQALRDLAPDMGSYVNENVAAELDWQHSFWGDNYARLLKIKRRLDPHDVFWCHPCVGNERWEERGSRLCRK